MTLHTAVLQGAKTSLMSGQRRTGACTLPFVLDLTYCSACQAKEARKEEEVRVGKAQMDAALAAGASWGFGEDAAEELVEGEEVDWRTYAETHSLTDNQVLASMTLHGSMNDSLCPD